MIELTDLQFAYGEDGFRLKIQNLSVPQGSRNCWVGSSGSGKTTLLHLVAGIFSPESGRVKTCGVELTAQRDAARRDFRIKNIGLVFQDFALLDYLSVRENILLPYRISNALQRGESLGKRVEALAARIGLADLLSRRPTQLSQGEQQRVAVCRAVITNPKLILADEPTANLDAGNATRVLDALDDYAAEQGATLVIVSHDRDVMQRFEKTLDVSSFSLPSQPHSIGEDVHA